jgi:tRNA dimethylallyltransferase
MNRLDTLAIIGPTASGKTSLALEWAAHNNGVILSLDSLSVYRYIDIASAKPSVTERGNIPHFGIDLLEPDATFDVLRFIDSYQEAAAFARRQDRPLIIVGGSGFYLKTLIDGLSPLPTPSSQILKQVHQQLRDLPAAHQELQRLDPIFVARMEVNDRYRIEKGLIIYYATGMIPSEYFAAHPPIPVIQDPLSIYEITVPRPLLRERIALRTSRMLREGLIDEVAYLEKRYTRQPNSMKAIGIAEVLAYLDGALDLAAMREKIMTNTARLAKRQETFNKSQFDQTIQGDLQDIRTSLWRFNSEH